MTSSAPNEVFYELMSDLSEDRISAGGAARLAEMLRDDPAMQRKYVDFLLIVGGLHRIRGEGGEAAAITGIDDEPLELPHVPFPSLTLTSPPTSSAFVGGPVFSYMVATLVLCMMLLGAWAYKVTHHSRIAGNGRMSAPTVDRTPRAVARITGMKDCKSTDGAIPSLVGVYIPLGKQFSFDAGLLEITYDNGARVILEGPCNYTVDSIAGGRLQLGKLVARVEKRVAGANPQAAGIQPPASGPQPLFSVRTPTAVITDLGTEFGVEVGEDGGTVSHVFQGEVNVRTLPGNNEPSKHINLTERQSVRILRNKGGVELDLVSVDSAGDSRRDVKQSENNLIAAKFVRRMPSPVRRKPICERSNPVSRGAVRIDGQFDDWKNIACYPDDPADDATSDPRTSVDLIRGAVAHDDENLYFFYEQANPTGILRYVPWIFLDTDLNRRTGRKQSRLEYPLRYVQSGNLRSGMDVKLEGGLLDTFPLPLGAEFNISGGSNLFVWDTVGLTKERILDFGTEGLEYAVSKDKKKVEMRVPRRLVGNPVEFDLIWIAQNRAKSAEGEKGITDFYPDGAGDTQRREYYRYSTDPARVRTMRRNENH